MPGKARPKAEEGRWWLIGGGQRLSSQAISAPEDWDYFCPDGVRYRGHLLTVAWDRTGERYGGAGVPVYIDKVLRHEADRISPLTLDLSAS